MQTNSTICRRLLCLSIALAPCFFAASTAFNTSLSVETTQDASPFEEGDALPVVSGDEHAEDDVAPALRHPLPPSALPTLFGDGEHIGPPAAPIFIASLEERTLNESVGDGSGNKSAVPLPELLEVQEDDGKHDERDSANSQSSDPRPLRSTDAGVHRDQPVDAVFNIFPPSSTISTTTTTIATTVGLGLPTFSPSHTYLACDSSKELPTFIRHVNYVPPMSRAMGMSANQKNMGSADATFVLRMSTLEECGDICRRQSIEGVDSGEGGGRFQCHGFAYSNVRKKGIAINTPAMNLCQFFDNSAIVIAYACRRGQTPKPNTTLLFQLRSTLPVPERREAPQSEESLPSNRTSSITYFERICLTIPRDCAESAFSFELYPGQVLVPSGGILLEQIVAEERKRCLDFCLSNAACRSVNYDTRNGSCQAMGSTWRMRPEGLQSNDDFDHYENTCFQQGNRCSTTSSVPMRRTRVDFLLTRHSEFDEDAFDMLSLPAPSMSTRNCMRECVESESLLCRSFLYSNATNQCIMTAESYEHHHIQGDLGDSSLLQSTSNFITSDTFDTYEPVCLDEEIDEGSECTKDHVFERLPGQNFATPAQFGLIKVNYNISLEDCIDLCMHEMVCFSFVYSARSVRVGQLECRLYSASRKSPYGIQLHTDPHVDYYELACQRDVPYSITTLGQATESRTTNVPNTTTTAETITTSSITVPTITTASNSQKQCNDGSNHVLIEHQRTLRLDYRNMHHVNVHSLEKCEQLCAGASLRCVTFAYNSRSSDCLLSTTAIDRNSRFALLTQPNSNYDLYTFVAGRKTCEDIASTREYTTTTATTANDTVTPTTTTTTTTSTTAFVGVPWMMPTINQPTVPRMEIESEEEVPTEMTTTAITTSTSTSPTSSALGSTTMMMRMKFVSDTKPSSTPSTNVHGTAPPTTATTRAQAILSPHRQITGQAEEDAESHVAIDAPIDADSDLLEGATSSNDFRPKSSATQPRQLLPHRRAEITRIDPKNLKVEAICLTQGANVSFKLDGEVYTGAVYAAERYTQCQSEVERATRFSIFVQRPHLFLGHNPCNSIEEEGSGDFSVVLVLSNDMVVPYDVTTRDDLFFEVKCDYGGVEGDEGIPRRGRVISGQNPLRAATTSSSSTSSSSSKPARDGKHSRASLKILRHGKPVRDVYVGEQLTAIIDSDAETDRLRVLDCNATRVVSRRSGTHRRKTTKLIDRGCTLMPEIIGNMGRGVTGRLEAPLTVFRIDGSDEVDILCTVVICRDRCSRKHKVAKCPHSQVSKRSASDDNGESNVDSDSDSGWVSNGDSRDSDEQGDTTVVTVEQRLRIMADTQQIVDSLNGRAELNEDNGLSSNEVASSSSTHRPVAKLAGRQTHHAPSRKEGEEGGFLASLLSNMGVSESVDSGDYCLSPFVLFVGMSFILIVLIVATVSLMTRWCRRKPTPSLANSMYPARIERFMA